MATAITKAPRRARLDQRGSVMPKVVSRGRRIAPWDDLYHAILRSSWLTFVVLTAAWFLATNAVYATLYLLQPGSISNVHGFEDAFYFSVESLTTIGFGVMTPRTRYGHLLVTSEALVGILSTALITGITFAKFARPRARVLFAEKIVIGQRDGKPTMTFRLANFRHNSIVEATLRIMVLVPTVTKEGESIRTPIELKLVRERSATFVLTWMVFHIIDESSPFFGGQQRLDELQSLGAEIWLALSGVDETVGQNMFSRYVLLREPDGTRVLDYHNFNTIDPQVIASGNAD
jgi:inward rectifier potassium channel